MGMYNEVIYKCPWCNGRGYMQIPQLVSGFGGFDLENYDTLRDLNTDDILKLKAYVLDNDFVCDNCGHTFNPYKDKNRELLIHKLFDVKTERNLEKMDISTLEEMYKLRQQESEIELELDEKQYVKREMKDT